MFQTILLLLIVLLALLVISILIGLYVRRFEKSDIVIAIYVTFVLLAQLLATKQLSFDIGQVAPAGVILFPFTFQMTDIINEFFGRKETQKAIFIAFITQIIMLFFFSIASSFPGSVFGDPNITGIWNSIFGFTFSITVASWIAFLISENLDAYIYQFFKKLSGGRKHLWIRNVFSDAVSITMDSIIFTPLAFLIIPYFVDPTNVFPLDFVISLTIGQSILKLLFGMLDTPFLYITRWLMYGELDNRFPILMKLKVKN